jgi:hypothetical protein
MTSKATKMQQEATKYQQQYILALAEQQKIHEQRNLLLADRAELYRRQRLVVVAQSKALTDWTVNLKKASGLYERMSSDLVAVIDLGLGAVDGLLQLKEKKMEQLQAPNERAALETLKARLKELRDNQTGLRQENSEMEAAVDALNASLKDSIEQHEEP